jgi:hypothetical protein
MRSRTYSWTNTLTKLGFARRRGRNRAKNGFARPLRAEGLEDRRMLAGFARVNATDFDVFAQGTAVTFVDGNIGTGGEYFSGVNGKHIARQGETSTQSGDDGLASTEVASLAQIIGPGPNGQVVGGPLYAPTVEAASQAALVANAFGFDLVYAQTVRDANANPFFQVVNDDPEEPLEFHGTLFLAAYGETVLADAVAEGTYHLIARIGGYYAEATYGLAASSWTVTTNIGGVQTFNTGSGVNHYFHFTMPVSSGASLEFYAEQLSGDVTEGIYAPTDSNTDGGFGQFQWELAASAWGYVTPVGEDLEDGDFNGDGNTDDEDLEIWEGGLQITEDDESLEVVTYTKGDSDLDGDVDADDYDTWLANTSAIVVSTAVDELDSDYTYGDLSLREALVLADSRAGAQKITFTDDVAATGGISLSSILGQLVVDSDVEIEGPGADLFTINANDLHRVFYINDSTSGFVDVSISGLTITGGKTTSSNHGAGIYSTEKLTLDHVKVVDNHAFNSGRGGGLYSTGNVDIVASTFDSNTAVHGAGAFIYSGSSYITTIADSTFSNNFATNSASVGSGGGVLLDGLDDALVTNSTFSGNEARYGGGIRVQNNVDLVLVNSTIYDNYALTRDGGLSHQGGSALVHNSILAGNVDADSGTSQDDAGGTIHSDSSNNLVKITNSSALLDTSVDHNIVITTGGPALAPLGNYGGPTMTHALLIGSPAIDNGNDSEVDNYLLTYDQRGRTRKINIAGVTDGLDGYSDIGAYETGNEFTITVGTLTDETDSDLSAADLSLREAIALREDLSGSATITFAESLFDAGPATLTLSQGLESLVVAQSSMNISGPGRDLLIIDANADVAHPYRVFTIEQSAVQLSGMTITGGYTASGLLYEGSGIYGDGSDVTLNDVRITGNETSSPAGGGGVKQFEGNLTVINSEIDNNISVYGGAGIQFEGNASGGWLIIDSSSVYSNQGLGVRSNGNTRIVNSTISSNTKGGLLIIGADSEFESAEVVNSTIAYNGTSSTSISGLHYSGDGLILLHNSIVAKNQANSVDKDVNGTFHTDSSSNFIGIITGSTGLTTNSVHYGTSTAIDPLLSSLGDWEGATKTHKLTELSDARNAGDDAIVALYELDLDQRGFDRIALDGADQVDIGAVESVFADF